MWICFQFHFIEVQYHGNLLSYALEKYAWHFLTLRFDFLINQTDKSEHHLKYDHM